MYGTETITHKKTGSFMFENDVKMYGTETTFMIDVKEERLRMM